MIKSSAPDIKREKKKSVFLRELSVFIDRISQEEAEIRNIFLSRVDLSADSGICYLFFAVVPGLTISDDEKKIIFSKALEKLKLYKPSLRKNLATTLNGRYTPDLIFMYDEKKDKIDRVNLLLDKVNEELKKSLVTVVEEENKKDEEL